MNLASGKTSSILGIMNDIIALFAKKTFDDPVIKWKPVNVSRILFSCAGGQLAIETSLKRLGFASIGGISSEADSKGSNFGCHSSFASTGYPEMPGWEVRILTNKVVPQRPVPTMKKGRFSLRPKAFPVMPIKRQAAPKIFSLDGH